MPPPWKGVIELSTITAPAAKRRRVRVLVIRHPNHANEYAFESRDDHDRADIIELDLGASFDGQWDREDVFEAVEWAVSNMAELDRVAKGSPLYRAAVRAISKACALVPEATNAIHQCATIHQQGFKIRLHVEWLIERHAGEQ